MQLQTNKPTKGLLYNIIHDTAHHKRIAGCDCVTDEELLLQQWKAGGRGRVTETKRPTNVQSRQASETISSKHYLGSQMETQLVSLRFEGPGVREPEEEGDHHVE